VIDTKFLKSWWEQLFHKEVLLEPTDDGFILWIERGSNGFYLPIPNDCLLFIAKQLNEVQVAENYKLNLVGFGKTDCLLIPRWAFNEARRLITLEALKGVNI
jgi:hypothetical protein